MRIYKDILTDAEVFCDQGVELEEEDGVMYVLKGKYIEVGGEDYGISANVDEDAAEGATGEVAEGRERVVDIVHNYRYTETFYDKPSYTAHIRGYLKKQLENIKDEKEKEIFKTNALKFSNKVLKNIDDYQFFIPPGNEEDPENSIVVLCRWEGETPKFYYWKHGLRGERV